MFSYLSVRCPLFRIPTGNTVRSLGTAALSLALLFPYSTQTADFTFNQERRIGQPMVSSFFGVPTNATYDYVVVGAGTAGLALASRLSSADISGAVVEARGFYEVDNGNLSVVPGYTTFCIGTDPANYQPLIDWGITTTPQPGSAKRKGSHQSPLCCGKR